jgi:hypothetical protein
MKKFIFILSLILLISCQKEKEIVVIAQSFDYEKQVDFINKDKVYTLANILGVIQKTDRSDMITTTYYEDGIVYWIDYYFKNDLVDHIKIKLMTDNLDEYCRYLSYKLSQLFYIDYFQLNYANGIYFTNNLDTYYNLIYTFADVQKQCFYYWSRKGPTVKLEFINYLIIYIE